MSLQEEPLPSEVPGKRPVACSTQAGGRVTDTLQGALPEEKTLWKLQKQILDYFLSLTKHKKPSRSLYRMNHSARWSLSAAIF